MCGLYFTVDPSVCFNNLLFEVVFLKFDPGINTFGLFLTDYSDFIIDFFKEARSAGRLNHPNIVQAYSVSEEDGIYYLVMEYIEGKNLKQIKST